VVGHTRRSGHWLVIRGAPAIGVAAAMGVALGARAIRAKKVETFQKNLDRICLDIKAARPTAVNLAWAVERMERLACDHAADGIDAIKHLLVEESLVLSGPLWRQEKESQSLPTRRARSFREPGLPPGK